jgi:phage-related minor tail protein
MSDTLGVVLKANNTQFVAGLAQASTETEKFQKRLLNAAKTVEQYNLTQKATQKAANDAVAGIKEASRHTEEFGFKTAGAKRELLVLAHELSQGNYKNFAGSMLVLGERTGAAALLFSGMGIAVLGVTAALGSFVAAVAIGAHDSEEFRKSLILTGNMAGQTASSFDALAASSAGIAHSTIGSGKQAAQSLIDSGRITQSVMGDATVATLLMEKVTGQSSDEVAKDFGKMRDDVAKWAEEHNKQFHYITASQFTYIKQLQDQGKLDEAQAENFRILNSKMSEVNANLGTLETGWKAVKDAASWAWDAMKGIGKSQTTAEQLDSLNAQLANATRGMDPKSGNLTGMRNTFAQQAEALRQQIYLLQEKAKLEQKSVTLQSQRAAADEAAIKKIQHPDKLPDQMPLGAIRDARTQYKQDFMQTEIASYEELAKAEQKAAEAAEKLSKEQDKSFGDWFQKFNEKEIAANADPSGARGDAIGKYLRDIGDQTKAAESVVNGSFQRMEDAIVSFAHTGKLSFGDLWGFMADEFLRQSIRMAEKNLLTDQAGNFIGVGGMLSGLGSLFSSFATPLAGGMESVPYDGFPAILHKGERVQTAVQARNSSSGGATQVDASINGLSVGAGVSLAQVNAAVNRAVSMSRESIMRSLRQQQVAA